MKTTFRNRQQKVSLFGQYRFCRERRLFVPDIMPSSRRQSISSVTASAVLTNTFYPHALRAKAGDEKALRRL